MRKLGLVVCAKKREREKKKERKEKVKECMLSNFHSSRRGWCPSKLLLERDMVFLS